MVRREFLKVSIVNIIMASSGVFKSAEASDYKLLSEEDAEAKELGYKSDASKIDSSHHAKYVKGQHCGNCGWFKGREGDEFAGCSMYSGGKQVHKNGWCSAWMKKTD